MGFDLVSVYLIYVWKTQHSLVGRQSTHFGGRETMCMQIIVNDSEQIAFKIYGFCNRHDCESEFGDYRYVFVSI